MTIMELKQTVLNTWYVKAMGVRRGDCSP